MAEQMSKEELAQRLKDLGLQPGTPKEGPEEERANAQNPNFQPEFPTPQSQADLTDEAPAPANAPSALMAMTPGEFDRRLKASKPDLFRDNPYTGMSPQDADAAIMAGSTPKSTNPQGPDLSQPPVEDTTPSETQPVSSPESSTQEPQTSAQSAPPAINPELNDDTLKAAQESARQKSFITNIGESFGKFAAEAPGGKFDNSFYKGLQEQAQQPVKDIEVRREALAKNNLIASHMLDIATKQMSVGEQRRLNDPNSAPSRLIKAVLENAHKKDIDFNKLPGWDSATGADALALQKSLTSEERLAGAKEALAYKAQQTENKADVHKSDKIDNDFMKFGKQVQGSIASSRGDFGKNSNVIRQAGQLEQLINQIKSQPDGADSRQYFELARQLDGMLSSGQGTITGTKELLPSTAQKKFAGMKEWLLSKPEGAGLQDFVKRAEDTINREKNYAVDRNAQTIAKMAPGFKHLKNADPERWNEILNAQGLDTNEDGDVIGIKPPKELTKTPTASTPAQQTVAPSVPSKPAPHGQTVVQNGHTYNWNPTTGKYE